MDLLGRTLHYHEKVDTEIVSSWLRSRGITMETAKRYLLGYCDEPLSELYNRITFPITGFDNEVIAIQGRYLYDWKSDKVAKYWNTSYTKSESLFGLCESLEYKDNGYCLVYEGPVDAISASQLKISTVAMLGLNFSERHAFLLSSMYDMIVVCLDEDEAGRTATKLIRDRMEKYNVDVVEYRHRNKDFNEDWVQDWRRTRREMYSFLTNACK